MPENTERHQQLMKAVRDSGAIDFTKLGQVVSDVAPQLFDPNVAADNYVIKAVTDIIRIWKLDLTALGLGDVAELQQMGQLAKTEQTHG